MLSPLGAGPGIKKLSQSKQVFSALSGLPILSGHGTVNQIPFDLERNRGQARP